MATMPERTTYAHGVPSWADVSSPDIVASAAFYGALFGWEHVMPQDPDATGGYGMFALRGRFVAGLGPLQELGAPAAWTAYIAVDDADEAATRAREHGGQVAMDPLDVFDAGRMAFLVDPAGAFVGVWQAGRHAGAELVGEPGAVGWTELACRDPAAVRPFYAGVFGWRTSPSPGGDGHYETFNDDGGPVAGLLTMTDRWPADVAPHWMTYVVVDDAPATAERAAHLGATVALGPVDVVVAGTIAVLVDPFGATFAIMQPPPG